MCLKNLILINASLANHQNSEVKTIFFTLISPHLIPQKCNLVFFIPCFRSFVAKFHPLFPIGIYQF
ncbi:hypothetical protein VCHA37P202_170111 [Vibrio chagasii]|nr:hypothetical protein VCHA37P202_170111 [Vibrio chagasii]